MFLPVHSTRHIAHRINVRSLRSSSRRDHAQRATILTRTSGSKRECSGTFLTVHGSHHTGDHQHQRARRSHPSPDACNVRDITRPENRAAQAQRAALQRSGKGGSWSKAFSFLQCSVLYTLHTSWKKGQEKKEKKRGILIARDSHLRAPRVLPPHLWLGRKTGSHTTGQKTEPTTAAAGGCSRKYT